MIASTSDATMDVNTISTATAASIVVPPLSPSSLARARTSSTGLMSSMNPFASSSSSSSSSGGGGGGNSKINNASMSKRQQAAQRARMVALSKQLKTRLQYAAFKVEHGWSKQSLSEVENLFYKHRRVSGSGSSPSAVAANGPSGTSPSSSSKHARTTASHVSLPSTPTPGRSARKSSIVGHTGEALGGLVTPPASGNTLPGAHHDRYKDLVASATPSFSSGLAPGPPSLNSRRSPSLSSGAGGTMNTQGPAKGGAKGTKRSYADFWSKIGGNASHSPGQEGVEKRAKTAT